MLAEPRVERHGDVVTMTMCRPERGNALSREHLTQLLHAVRGVGATDAADVAGAPLTDVRSLLAPCTELMRTLHAVPQVVVARVHALATAAGAQRVASCDLAAASKAWGKQAMHAQLDRPEADAYLQAVETTAAASQLDGARDGMAAFLGKRPAVWTD